MKFRVSTEQPVATVMRTYGVEAESEDDVRDFKGEWILYETETENHDGEEILNIEEM